VQCSSNPSTRDSAAAGAAVALARTVRAFVTSNVSRTAAVRGRIALLVFLAAAGFAGRPADGSTFSGTVVSVADGDTVTVRVNGHTEKVRLFGIDCPERHQAFGTRARRTTSELTAGRQIRVDVVGRDDYGRLLGKVILADGRNLNQELVRRGLAWWYSHYSRDAALAALEADARAARRGLWVDPHPMPPWEFRRREHAPRTDRPPRGP